MLQPPTFPRSTNTLTPSCSADSAADFATANREKHGWMGDAEAATWSAVANFDSAAIYRSWVRSMLDNQAVNCATPSICGQVSGIFQRCVSPV